MGQTPQETLKFTSRERNCILGRSALQGSRERTQVRPCDAPPVYTENMAMQEMPWDLVGEGISSTVGAAVRGERYGGGLLDGEREEEGWP